MKPPLTYFGGKQQLSRIITPLIPKHRVFVEPYFGGGAIFFAKDPSPLEVINDTNGDLVNFYKVVKDDFKELQKEIKKTLHSRELHGMARVVLGYPSLFNDVKRAWAIWVLANEGYASRLDSPWGYDRKGNTIAKRVSNKRERFTNVYAERLAQTEIECRDALSVIKTRDSADTFHYCDPPYFNAGMGHYAPYTERDFESLLQLLSCIKGKFLLSSSPSELLARYAKKYKWNTKVIEMPLAITAKYNTGKKKREVLTANYPIENDRSDV